MHLFRASVIIATLVIVSSTAHADFFDVVKKVGQVAEAANTVQAIAEGRPVTPAVALGAAGGSKHGASSHGKHHK